MTKKTEYPGITTLSDGRFRVRATVTTWDQRRLDRQVTLPAGSSFQDAVQAKEALLKEMEKDAQPPASLAPTLAQMSTVGDYARYWFDMRAPTLTSKSLKSYFSHLDRHILPHIGHVPIAQLSRSHVVQMVAKMDAARQPDGTGYSRATRRGWWRVALGVTRPGRRCAARVAP